MSAQVLCLHIFQTKNSIEKLQKEIIKICDDAHVAVDKVDFSQWKDEIQEVALGKPNPFEIIHKRWAWGLWCVTSTIFYFCVLIVPITSSVVPTHLFIVALDDILTSCKTSTPLFETCILSNFIFWGFIRMLYVDWQWSCLYLLAESIKKAEIELTDTEDYVINVAELLSVGQLPETIKSCVGGDLLKLAWESGISAQCFSKNSSVGGKKDTVLSFFRKLNLTEDSHRQLMQSSVTEIRFKIGKSFQREIDKSYLNIFQLSSNARRLTGKKANCYLSLFTQVVSHGEGYKGERKLHASISQCIQW